MRGSIHCSVLPGFQDVRVVALCALEDPPWLRVAPLHVPLHLELDGGGEVAVGALLLAAVVAVDVLLQVSPVPDPRLAADLAGDVVAQVVHVAPVVAQVLGLRRAKKMKATATLDKGKKMGSGFRFRT